MKKVMIYIIAAALILAVLFFPAPYNVKGDGRIDTDIDSAVIECFVPYKINETQFDEEKTELSKAETDDLKEILKSLEPKNFYPQPVSISKGGFDGVSVRIRGDLQLYEVRFYKNSSGFEDTALVSLMDENGDSIWSWKTETDAEALNKIFGRHTEQAG